MARPTIYTEELASDICSRLAGGESLRSICRDDDQPHISTILLWVVDGKHEAFSEQYMQAREAAGFSHADRIIDTIDQVALGDLGAQEARAMLDGLKWAAERMSPKSHGQKQSIDHSSSDRSMSPAGLGHFYGEQDDDGED